MKIILRISLLAVLALPILAQVDFDQVEIEATHVGGTVYMLKGLGGNIGASIGEDGIVLIDDQYAPLAPKIRAALAELSDKEILYVLNTHWHGDHTGGNEFFGETAPIIAHHNVRKRLAEGMDLPGRTTPPAPEGALPVLTFGDDLVLHLNGETIEAIHLPEGHTDGDLVVWFPRSNVIHMGDHYFAGRFPFIDLASGGSVRGLIRNLHTVIERVPATVRIIPGHGPLSTITEMKTYLAMIEETAAVVVKAIEQGLTLDEMKERAVLSTWDDWSWNFITTDRYLTMLHDDLSTTRRSHKAHHRHGTEHGHRNERGTTGGAAD
jgi:cyclase